MRKSLLVLMFVVLASSLAFCDDREVKMGQDYDQRFCAQNKISSDPDTLARVKRIGDSLGNVATRRDITYHFKVYESKQFGAFSLPGGFVYVSTGLVERCLSDDEIAAVMAHEVAHIDLGHGVIMHDRVERAQKKAKFLDVVTSGWASVLSGVKMMRVSREQEGEADRLSLKLVKLAGYNPVGIVGVMSLMIDEEKGAPSNQPSLFQTHPSTKKRYDYFYTQVVEDLFSSVECVRPVPSGISAIVTTSGERLSMMGGIEKRLKDQLVREQFAVVEDQGLPRQPVYRIRVVVGEQPTGSLNISLFVESRGVDSDFCFRSVEVAWVKLSESDTQKTAWVELSKLVDQAIKLIRADQESSYRGLVVRWSTNQGKSDGHSKLLWEGKTPKRGVAYEVLDGRTGVKKGAVEVSGDNDLSVIEGTVSAGDILINAFRKIRNREEGRKALLFSFTFSDPSLI